MQRLESDQGLPKVEIKTEISLNRITSRSDSSPRQIERVPVGSKFDFELVYGIYEVNGLRVHDIDLLDRVFFALRLVEDSALGASGSRGYGQVRFHLGPPVIKTVGDYQSGAVAGTEAAARKLGDRELIPLNGFSEAAVSRLKAEVRAQLRPASRPKIEPPAAAPVEEQAEPQIKPEGEEQSQ
jgi:CRISPR/Cas system CSM-associated protein Csm3 (group 7 of RAMP superfamily)